MGKDKEREKNGRTRQKYEDITSHSAPKGLKGKLSHFNKYKLRPFFMKNHKRNLKTILVILACMVVVFGGVYYLVQSKLGLIHYDLGQSGNPDATFATEADISYANMHDVADANSLKSLIKSWATNGGEKLRSGNVVNVLLLGCDEDGGSSRSDSMILVSINRKTQKITLTSFLRDSYTYMNITNAPANRQERFDKVNHSYAWGGASDLIETLENDYKIVIDHYVSIDFKSFVSAVDALGGVNVPITAEEARYMNRTTHFNDFTSGDSVKLDGAHALIFSRIRHNDSEVERTRRQRCVIEDLINKAKGASIGQLNTLVNNFLPFVTTNYSKSQIIALGTQAISEKWMNYSIKSMVEPAESLRKGVYINTWSSNRLFVWIIDYPLAARELQQALYGTTNIVIDSNHISAFDFLSDAEAAMSYNTTKRYYENEDEPTEEQTYRRPWSGFFGGRDETTTTSSYEEDENTTGHSVSDTIPTIDFEPMPHDIPSSSILETE